MAFVLTAAACGSKNDGFDDGKDHLIGESDAGDADASSCEGLRCSADLHKVIDGCTQDVIQECASDMGCAKGTCVPACDSVAASQGSIGCSFFTTPPDTLVDSETSCFAAFVANTWTTPVNVTAEYGSTALDLSKSIYRAVASGNSITYEPIVGAIPPGELGIVFLAEGMKGPNNPKHLGCPAGTQPAWRGTAVKDHTTSLYSAFHLTTDAPVSAYSLFPYGGATSYLPSATLLLPTPSWDTNYLLVDGWNSNASYPFVQIVAQEDGTEVRIRPRVDILDGKGVVGGIRGSITKWTLARGQVLELTQEQSLAGSPIEASHPVAVFGGSQCAFVGNEDFACDSLHQQIAPIHEWSSSYSAVPYKSRRRGLDGSVTAPESVYFRFVGAADGTRLTYSPAPPPNAPVTLGSGEVVTFNTDQIFSVKSQDSVHPFYLAVYMSGADKYRTTGDPDFVNLVPDDQFLDRYVFFLDHTYAESNLTLVRRKDATGFHDVTLDCVGTVGDWQPLGTDGTAEYTWVDMTRAHVGVPTAVGTCEYGRHEAQSDGPFALYVWGTDSYASYGFPAGAGSRPTSPYSIVVR